MDYEVEFRSYTDDAWYSVRLVFDGEKLTVKYRNFADDQDDVFEPGGFNSLEELEEFQGRFRPVSPQLQDSECHKVVKGMVVCAAYTFNPNDVRFYDAIVDEVVPRKHSFENGGEECRCTFILLWKSAGCLSSNNIESMCLIQQNAQLNPMVSSFLEIATKKSGFVSHMDNPIRVSSSPLKRKSNFAERLQQGKKCAKRSLSKIHPSKDIPLGFIAKETQDCKENLEKLCEFLESPNHIIISARGRPWVVTQKFSWHDTCRMSHEKLMLKSQYKIPNRIGGIGNELQVVHSGTGKYRTAKELRDLFMEFANHQQQLHKRLAAAEAEISRRSV